MNTHESGAPKNVVKADGGFQGALDEAKALKVKTHGDYVIAKNRGDGKNFVRALCESDSVNSPAASVEVKMLLTGDDKGLEIGGKFYSWDSLQDRGIIGDGDRIGLHYMAKFLLKVASSVGEA